MRENGRIDRRIMIIKNNKIGLKGMEKNKIIRIENRINRDRKGDIKRKG